MKRLIIIPARLAAVRFPNKPLHPLQNHPMILHVWQRALQVNAGDVIVACDDPRIASVIEEKGGQVILTPSHLPSGTDRIYAAWEALGRPHYDVLINLQGDMPLFPQDWLEKITLPFEDPSIDASTVVFPSHDPQERFSPHTVKAIIAGSSLEDPFKEGWARCLYFSRAPIPFAMPFIYHHVGIYAYRPEALQAFAQAKPSFLEKAEQLEQLRFLEQGYTMGAYIAPCPDYPIFGIDTPQDAARMEAYLKLSPAIIA